jgi:hypothetical protein
MGNKKYTLFIVGFCIMLTACSKRNDDISYGNSITVPNIIGTAVEVLTKEQINILRSVNAFQTTAFPAFFSQNANENLAFSSLYLFGNLSENNLFETYFDKFYDNFDIKNPSNQSIEKELLSIYNLVSNIDSSFSIKSNAQFLKDSSLFVSQSIELMFFYEEAITPQRAVYDKKKSVYSFNGSFNVYQSDKEFVAEVPFGNGDYSLVMIKPNENFEDYVSTFSERKYMTLIDNLRNQNINLVFPVFDFKTDTLLLSFPRLKTMQDDSAALPSLKLQMVFNFIAPTYAMIASKGKDIDKKIIESATNGRIEFDKDFIFLIRGRYSNIILLSGVYRN